MKDDKKQSQRQEKLAKWRRFAKRRWVYPAVYLGFAALVVASVLWMQNPEPENFTMDKSKKETETEGIVYEDGQEAVPVANSPEKFRWPVADKETVHITKRFYDEDASPEEQQAALVYYNHTYRPNKGVNFATESGDSFAVTAAMSGTVIQAEKDELLGYVVKIDHGQGVVTMYQSLSEVAVEVGDKVEQGEKIGMAGRNTYNKNAGVHLHFEIRKDGEQLNPLVYFGKTLAALPDVDSESTSENEKSPKKENKSPQSGEKEQKNA